MKITNKRVRKLTTIVLVAAASLLSGVSMAAPDNVGFVYVTPIGDAGWTYQHDQGRLQMEKETGVTTSYVENVSEGADAERVIREMAKRGDKVI
ncbi:MAG: BMP family ABC transporter substrate-binding protein, partial [Gammaproteobacteria bacterium]|nr:BMP family ABC transporter substrate-binding protein [Gammaproteobacteria bacterium]